MTHLHKTTCALSVVGFPFFFFPLLIQLSRTKACWIYISLVVMKQRGKLIIKWGYPLSTVSLCTCRETQGSAERKSSVWQLNPHWQKHFHNFTSSQKSQVTIVMSIMAFVVSTNWRFSVLACSPWRVQDILYSTEFYLHWQYLSFESTLNPAQVVCVMK